MLLLNELKFIIHLLDSLVDLIHSMFQHFFMFISYILFLYLIVAKKHLKLVQDSLEFLSLLLLILIFLIWII